MWTDARSGGRLDVSGLMAQVLDIIQGHDAARVSLRVAGVLMVAVIDNAELSGGKIVAGEMIRVRMRSWLVDLFPLFHDVAGITSSLTGEIVMMG